MALNEVVFKSNTEYFEKENDGRKPNTMRKVSLEDNRFIILAHMAMTKEYGYITIVENAKDGRRFKREIRDISFYDGYCIISWQHK